MPKRSRHAVRMTRITTRVYDVQVAAWSKADAEAQCAGRTPNEAYQIDEDEDITQCVAHGINWKGIGDPNA